MAYLTDMRRCQGSSSVAMTKHVLTFEKSKQSEPFRLYFYGGRGGGATSSYNGFKRGIFPSYYVYIHALLNAAQLVKSIVMDM